MRVQTETSNWITGEELGEERRRLLAVGVPESGPRFEALLARVTSRGETLFESFGQPLIERFPDKWIALSVRGEVLVRDTAGEAVWAASESSGTGNAAVRKLAAFRSSTLHR